ncbi:MAG: chemotaxis protein CheX [Moraxella sp.]|nr:chemotaxis protein CheX [Moraxella sp.]
MKVEKLSVFVRSVSAFFEQLGVKLSDIDTPYLNDNISPVAHDYTGVITISGPLKGAVYVSASTALLRELLKVLKEVETLALLRDLVGEIANTVAGNARIEFGSEFVISPPKVVDGTPGASFLPKNQRTYTIPFSWHEHAGVIGICIEAG